MEIRELELEDGEQVIEIMFAYKRECNVEPPEDKRALMLETLQGLIGREGSVALVALEGGVVAGIITAHHFPMALIGGDDWYISELFIKREFRGHGIGSALITEIEQRARAAGGARMNLINFRTIDSYKRGFYNKQGFVERKDGANFVKSLR